MQNFIIKYTILLFLIISTSCTDLLTDDEQYKSVHLKDGAWIQFSNIEIQEYLTDDFTIEIWVSGDSNESNDAKTLLSIIEDANDDIIFGVLRNTTIDNGLEIYINNELIETITDDNLDWSKKGFNLISITCAQLSDGTDNDIIKIFVNDSEVFSYEGIDFQIGNNNLIIGGKVNTSQTSASNFWTGYIDELRLWNDDLTLEEITFHLNNPTKLVSSSGCSNQDYTTPETCEDVGETWSGTYADDRLNNLVGLWRFNYSSPRYTISDESCKELNLDSGISDSSECNEIDGLIYTLPGYNVQFSKSGV